MEYVSSSQLATQIIQNVESSIYESKCLIHPVDITPTYARRSTAVHSVMSAGPVLLLTGPHLSLLSQAEEDLYVVSFLPFLNPFASGSVELVKQRSIRSCS